MAESSKINPEMLRWARETAGLPLDVAAEKLALRASAKQSGAEKLASLEAGDQVPSDGLLERAAAAYHRPLITFYLPKPPGRGDRGEDFRSTKDAVSDRENALLDTLLRDVRARQRMLSDLIRDDEDAEPLPFIGSSRAEKDPAKVSDAIRTTLAVTTEQQRRARGTDELFGLLRSSAERIGIFVLLLGDVGSHQTDLSESVFRGFALTDAYAPFVVINDNDAKAARSFTLVHELAHLWVGVSAVSGPVNWTADTAVERFCNEVAGLFLLPKDVQAAIPVLLQADLATAMEQTNAIAREWNVSQGVVAFRMVSERRITPDLATDLFKAFADRWRAEKDRASSKAEVKKSGPSYYVVRRHRLGSALLDVVRRAIQEDAVSHTKAARILGVKPTLVTPLLAQERRAA